jgi:hypothetical protein
MKTILRTITLMVLLVSMAIAQAPWTKQTSGNTQTLRRIVPVNSQVVWACGYAGVVLRTVNGGTTWQKVSLTDVGFDNYSMDAIDSSTAWVAGLDATSSTAQTNGEVRVWKTTNGGTTWTQQYKNTDSWPDAVRFYDANNGIILGDPSKGSVTKYNLFTTSNGGTTWTAVPAANTPTLDSASTEMGLTNGLELVGNSAWLITYGNGSTSIKPRIFKSADKGLTWTFAGRAAANDCNGFSMADQNKGIFSNTSNGAICRTTNGWASSDSVLLFSGTYGLRWIDWIPGTNSIVVVGGPSGTGFSAVSTDGGTTWTQQAVPAGVNRLRHVAFANSSTGWASSTGGDILKWTGPDLAPVAPQLYMSDDFTSPNGTVLTSAGWTQSATSATNPLTIASPGLTFPGHPGSGVGGAVAMANNGQDDYKAFPPVSSGDVYLSFLMNVSAVQSGDYVIALSPSASQVNYIGRLHIQSSGAGFNVGIKKSNETGAQYGASVFNLNTTYFVVMKYTFTGTATDTTNDPISIYVVPSGSSIATEPAIPEVSAYVNTTKNDAVDLSYVTIRQGSATSAPTMTIDAIRVGNSWAAATAPAVADFINVTFTANAAAWRDTLSGASGLVQLRGTTMTGTQSVDDGTTDTLSTGTIIDWNAKTTMNLTNIGGDYWKGTFKIKPGTKISYKFFANAQNKVVKPGDSFEHDGWENNVVDIPGFYSTNRGLDLTGVTKDTVLPVQFINGIGHGLMKQYDKPYTVKDSTYALYVRVDMAGWEDFNPASHKIAVRGSNKSDWGQTGELSWGPSYQLNREGVTSFYSNVIHVPNKYATAGVQFKFVVHYMANPLSEDWGAMAYNPGTQYDLTTTGVDSTIQWKWFDNLKPTASSQKDTVIVTYLANMNKAISQRGFAHGDTIQVRAGYGGTAAKVYMKQLTRVGLTTLYSAVDTLVTSLNKTLNYQYYLLKYGLELKEIYFDFDFPDPSSADAERRHIVLTSKTFSILDTVSSTASGRRVPQLRNTKLLSKAVTVKYTVNIKPAIYQVAKGDTLKDIQGTISVIKKDSIMKWGIFINGPATGGWGPWGGALRSDTTRKMFDDGTHGDDVAGDSIYTRTFVYKTTDILGQEFKFGVGGGDNEAGFGNNHYYIIDDTGPTATAASQYGSIYPKFYSTWDFDLGRPKSTVGVKDEIYIPLVASLSQNYPNPFNPSTTIRFTLTSEEIVTLKIFNTLGQEVMTLVHEKMGAGNHVVKFDAAKLTSGVYFYQINAGKLVETKKMMLLK